MQHTGCPTLSDILECHVENSTRFLNHPGKAEFDRPDYDLKLSDGFHLRFYYASIKIERGTESGA